MNIDITFIEPYTKDKEYWINTVVNEKSKLFGTEVKIPNTSLLLYTGIINLSNSDIHIIHTPIKLVSEIMSHFPNGYDFKSKQYAVLYTFEWALYLKYVLGVPPENITVFGDGEERFRLSMYEGFNYSDANKLLSDEICVIMKRHEKENNKILHMKQDITKKFNVVLGNPPYQKSTDDSSFTNLWADFVHKAYNMSCEFIAMITPKTWGNQVTKENNSSRVFGLIKQYGTYVNIDECKKHFPAVGSSFSYYILDKQKKTKDCYLITEQGKLQIVWDSIPFIPNNFNVITIGIITKLLSRRMFDYVSSSGTVGEVVEFKDDTHIYSIRYSMGTEKWSNKEHKFQNVPKLVFPNQTTKNYPIYAPHSAPANRGVFYPVKDKDHADRMLSYFKSKLIQFLISEQRTHHGVLNTQVIQRIPFIDVSHTWTDEELYVHFGLTQEEIDYIESNVK